MPCASLNAATTPRLRPLHCRRWEKSPATTAAMTRPWDSSDGPAAFGSRDAVLRQFRRLARYRRATEHGCICGKRNCETLEVVDIDWINDRIVALLRQEQAG
jgi:hypothetical protein